MYMYIFLCVFIWLFVNSRVSCFSLNYIYYIVNSFCTTTINSYLTIKLLRFFNVLY